MNQFLIEYPSMTQESHWWWFAGYQEWVQNKEERTAYTTYNEAWTELERMKANPINSMVWDARIVRLEDDGKIVKTA